MEDKYVKLSHVQELLKLIRTRDQYMDWTTEYEVADRKVGNTVHWLERNAKTKSQLWQSN